MNHAAEQAYGTQRTQSWSRVDMLLALYEATLRSLDGMLEAEGAGEAERLRQFRLKAIRQVLGVAAGLDLNQGEVARQTARLCEFVHHAIMEGSPTEWQSARAVLATLHEGFSSVREEAVLLEAKGEIPSVDEQTTVEVRL